MKNRILVIAGALVLLVIAFTVIDAVTNYRIRHQEPWKLVADCEYNKVTRIKFGESLSTPDGRYSRDDKFAVLDKAKAVDEGKSKKKVMKLLGPPTFVEGTTTDEGAKFGSCEWHYVFSGRREPSGYFTERNALVIAFDEIGEVKSSKELGR
jgi:outer membrane protein assembly factor BamE (lipoprotein component of BamABCDE complex)